MTEVMRTRRIIDRSSTSWAAPSGSCTAVVIGFPPVAVSNFRTLIYTPGRWSTDPRGREGSKDRHGASGHQPPEWDRRAGRRLIAFADRLRPAPPQCPDRGGRPRG